MPGHNLPCAPLSLPVWTYTLRLHRWAGQLLAGLLPNSTVWDGGRRAGLRRPWEGSPSYGTAGWKEWGSPTSSSWWLMKVSMLCIISHDLFIIKLEVSIKDFFFFSLGEVICQSYPNQNWWPSFCLILMCCAQTLGHVWLCATPWTGARLAPLSMEFSRQEYWSGLPFPSPGDLPDSRIKFASPALAGRFFTAKPLGEGR